MANKYTVSATGIIDYVWDVREYLYKKYGPTQGERDLDPLIWYINTGRASTLRLHELFSIKPYVVGRRLHQGGSYDEVITRVFGIKN